MKTSVTAMLVAAMLAPAFTVAHAQTPTFSPVKTTFMGSGELIATDNDGKWIDCSGTFEIVTDIDGNGTLISAKTPESCRLQFASVVTSPLRVYDKSDAYAKKMTWFIDGRPCPSNKVQLAFFNGVEFASLPWGGKCGFSSSVTFTPAITMVKK
jgi:hypothetical protein